LAGLRRFSPGCRGTTSFSAEVFLQALRPRWCVEVVVNGVSGKEMRFDGHAKMLRAKPMHQGDSLR
jgi:hypothetical protein